jgi:hypothetical protein
MSMIDLDYLPYPVSMLLLTGISFATLLYVTYPKDINKIPQQLSSHVVSIGTSVGTIGSSIRQGANKIITPVAEAISDPIKTTLSAPSVPVVPAVVIPTGTTGPTAPTGNNGIVSGITDTLSSLNPFAKPALPAQKETESNEPPKIGGSKKRRQKKSKKTKRLRKK